MLVQSLRQMLAGLTIWQSQLRWSHQTVADSGWHAHVGALGMVLRPVLGFQLMQKTQQYQTALL